MAWLRTAACIGALILGVGCTGAPRMTTADRLEFYRAHAGEPVRSFRIINGRPWGWRALGDSSLTVWTRHDRGFLLDLTGRCPDLTFATSIGLTNQAGHVSAGFDSVLVPRRAAAGGPTSCRIRTIRPLETRVVKESKRDLQEADVVERDPAMPDEAVPEVNSTNPGGG